MVKTDEEKLEARKPWDARYRATPAGRETNRSAQAAWRERQKAMGA